MNRRLLVLLAVVPLLLAAAAPFAPPTTPLSASPFQGTWQATDTADGSRMRLWIRPDKDIDGLYEIKYFDQSCGGCDGLPGTGRFVALADGDNHLWGLGYFRSQGQTYFYQMDGHWYYNPVTDTIDEVLSGVFSTTWNRASPD
jgi:hypothetical protein